MNRVSLIAAIGAKTRALGKDNKLIWHLPEDLKYFKQLTTGHPIIMGRKTFESIGRPLPNRTNIVISRDTQYHPEGVTVTQSLDAALEHATLHENSEIFIIGGGQIYTQALPYTDRLYLTLIEEVNPIEADTFFPEYKNQFTKIVSEERNKSAETVYTNIVLEKK